MILRRVLALVAVSLSLIAFDGSVSALEVPPAPRDIPIVDQAEVLTPEQEQSIAAKIAAERSNSGNQIGVMATPRVATVVGALLTMQKSPRVGGSSAGACLFSTYYFFNKELGILEGLGVLPIRLLVHFGNPEYDATNKSLTMLQTYPSDLELVTIEECAWMTKEVDWQS